MIRNCITAVLVALAVGAIGCRACDDWYEEGPIVGGGCPDCGPTVRSGSNSGGGYPAGPAYHGPPVYTQPGAVQSGAVQPAPARPMVPVRPGN